MCREEYVLRPRDVEEISRLEHQHKVWKEVTDQVIRRAGFRKGDRLLDLGCGPGFLTFELADLVGAEGSVLAVDNSERFIRHLEEEAESRRLGCIRTQLADARRFEIPQPLLDGGVCRWVLMFLPDAEGAVARAAQALRRGAMLAVMEYVQFRSISLWPDGRHFKRLYEAVHQLIAGFGGDADRGGRVPQLLQDAGFEIVDLLPFWRVGRPGSPLWEWLEGTGVNHANLVEAGLLSEAELEAYFQEWKAHSSNPCAFLAAPPLLATVARKL